MIRKTLLLTLVLLPALPALAQEARMVRLAGSPEQIGTTWGQVNREIILHDFEAAYLEPAAAAGISKETLLERSAAYVQIVAKIAPHWLEESRATARTVGVPEDLFIAFYGGVSRKMFLHECTSYAVAREHARDGLILFHKNRDNVDRPQAVFIIENTQDGVNKFIGVSNVSFPNGLSMMVNEKGLAGSGDYPANRKRDSSTLRLEPAKPRYRGLPGGAILRYVAERASSCEEALDVIEDFVASDYYAGGDVGGKHWLFVDRNGVVLEVCSNEKHVVSKVHKQKAYFSRLNNSTAARRLRDARDPIDFHLFHNTSRDPSICFGSSISGMTVEIDPTHPEMFTCAWVSLPARCVSFPLLMGQSHTPKCLLDGKAYALGKQLNGKASSWEDIERKTRAAKQQLKEKLTAGRSANQPEETVREMDRWSASQAGMLVKRLKRADGPAEAE